MGEGEDGGRGGWGKRMMGDGEDGGRGRMGEREDKEWGMGEGGWGKGRMEEGFTGWGRPGLTGKCSPRSYLVQIQPFLI